MTIATKGDWKGTWSTNYTINRRRYAPDLRELKIRSLSNLDNIYGRYRTVSIIVGAGPSLDESIVDLKRLNRRKIRHAHLQRVILFSTDAALKTLLKHKINPDYVVALDEHSATESFYSGIRRGKMSLIGSLTMPPDAIEHFIKPPENKVYFYGNANQNVFDIREEFGLTRESHPGIPWIRGFTNSVSMMSIVIAQRMGIKAHFLVGNDYFVIDDGNGYRLHCNEMPIDEKDFEKDDGEKLTRDEYVERVRSAMGIHLGRIHSMPHRNKYPVYNCSAGGRLKWNNMPLLDAAVQFGFMKRREDGEGESNIARVGQTHGKEQAAIAEV